MLEILLVWAASKKIAAMAYDKSYSQAARVGFVIMFIGLWFGGEQENAAASAAARKWTTTSMTTGRARAGGGPMRTKTMKTKNGPDEGGAGTLRTNTTRMMGRGEE